MNSKSEDDSVSSSSGLSGVDSFKGENGTSGFFGVYGLKGNTGDDNFDYDFDNLTSLNRLAYKIDKNAFSILDDLEFSFHLFFGDRYIEKTKTLPEMIKLRNEKYNRIQTTIISFDRKPENETINIGCVPPWFKITD